MDSRRKQIQIDKTINWIGVNYEWSESVCIPRCLLYQHYLEFCQQNQFQPVGPASFGKIVRQRFSKVTTRRLGTRGQSIYHYCGIGIKATSVYYTQVYNGKKVSRFSAVKIKTEAAARKYSLNSKTGTLLPDFPALTLPNELNQTKVSTFIVMYKTHSQRILDTVIGANFNDIQKFLFHFWNGIPIHLMATLDSNVLIDFISYCDAVLYKVTFFCLILIYVAKKIYIFQIINDVLVPSSIQEIPESLCNEIKVFVNFFPLWLEHALISVPLNLQKIKLNVAKKFCKYILRQLSFLHLAQTVRGFLADPDITRHIFSELQSLDINEICLQFGLMINSDASSCQQLIQQYFSMFLTYLQKQLPLEEYIELIDELMDMYVIKKCEENISFQFLLRWNYLTFLFVRDLTLKSACSFGSVHLIQLMFDEYIQLVLEGLEVKKYEKKLKENVDRYFQSDQTNKLA
uniref:RFX-type winged-helix domain-containing protein n=1 Tax=Strigamia maritima TaxID=126957 RepID=T1JF65_STRMM